MYDLHTIRLKIFCVLFPPITLKSPEIILIYMKEAQNAEDAIAMAKADLSKRLSIGLELIDVIASEECTWGDSSLGFPDPGMSYAQILTTGYRVVLRAAGGTFEYRLGDGIMKMR
jgi:hypothetical protein